jgi:hypothetical protein
LAWAIAVAALPASACLADVSARVDQDHAFVANARQRVEFSRAPDGLLRLSTFVLRGNEWTPLFDGQAPVVQGQDFDLQPGEVRLLESSSRRAVLEASGEQPQWGFPWELQVEANDETDLIRFSLVCHIVTPLTLAGLEPQFALWMTRPTVALAVNQGPGSICSGSADAQWGNSFPAAYLWDQGVEAAIFLDMTPMTWMSHRNLFRFHDCRAQVFAEGGRTALGLRVVKRNFHEVLPGDLRFEAYLHAQPCPERPTRREALRRLVDVFAPLHPRQAAPFRLGPEGKAPSWEDFAEGVASDLRLRGVVWDDIPLLADGQWRDEPMFPEDTVDTLRVSTDYAVGSACDSRWSRTDVSSAWDFSTCNNYLAPLAAHERLHPDAALRSFIVAKAQSLPLFYDPNAGLIRHGTRHPEHIGDKEMAWQNLMFALETAKTARTLAPENCSPRLTGRFLMGVDGLIGLAHHVDYLFPQWFDPYTKSAAPQADVPELGIVFEPWQAGTYAQVMCEAHAVTGDERYLKEAQAALARLFEGPGFRVANERYDVTYDDLVDYPITEVFGNAWGVAAAYRIYRLTGDERYGRYSDGFLDSLLRMTYWYESELRDDPKDLAMRTAGLFRNHDGAFTGSPWENSEVYLALLQRIREEPEPRAPLLQLFSLYRTNSFTYFPAVFPPEAMPCDALRAGPAGHLPIEDAYTHEHGGANGAMGRSIYMSGIALWNDVLFEAFAVADDPDTMVLSLDALGAFDAAVASAARSFLVYNPVPEARTTRVRMKALADGDYAVRISGPNAPDTEARSTAVQLRQGLEVRLPAGGHLRISVHSASAEALVAEWRLRRQAGDRLAQAYYLLQTAGGRLSASDTAAVRASYRSAESALLAGDTTAATAQADSLAETLARLLPDLHQPGS